MTNPIPDGFNTVTPHLIIEGAAEAIEFYKKAFGAQELFRMPGPDGAIMHAEIQIGNSRVMVAQAMPDWGTNGAKHFGGSPVCVHLYVEDVDSVMKTAAEAGAEVTMPAQDTFWGDRYGKLSDPFGHVWSVATHVKDMTPEEIAKAQEEFFSANNPG